MLHTHGNVLPISLPWVNIIITQRKNQLSGIHLSTVKVLILTAYWKDTQAVSGRTAKWKAWPWPCMGIITVMVRPEWVLSPAMSLESLLSGNPDRVMECG